jgi:hypothetical protein
MSIKSCAAKTLRCNRLDQNDVQCPFLCSSGSRLKRHVKSYHDKIKDINCSRLLHDNVTPCTYTCSQKDSLEKHILWFHDKIKNIKCDKFNEAKNGPCDYICSTKQSLSFHIKAIHEKAKDIKCDRFVDGGIIQCSYMCCSLERMKKHIKAVHDRIKDIKCNRMQMDNFSPCPFACSRMDTLRLHQKMIHDKNKDVICTRLCDDQITQCSFVCSTNAILRRHVKTQHDKIKDLMCGRLAKDNITVCSFACSNNSTLANHVKSKHDLVKNIKCSMYSEDGITQCSYVCSKQWLLSQHVKHKHSKVKDIKCKHEQCAEVFAFRGIMIRHWERMHSKQYKLLCSECGYGCFVQRELKTHNDREHEGKPKTYIKREEQKLLGLFVAQQYSYEYNRKVKLCTIPGERKKYAQFDFVIDRSNYIVVLEIDEFAHGQNRLVSDATFQSKRQKLTETEYQETVDKDILKCITITESESNTKHILHDCGSVEVQNKEISRKDRVVEETSSLCPRRTYSQSSSETDCSRGYIVSCEQDRMMSLIAWFRANGEKRPILIIRYNPHSFKLDGVIQNVDSAARQQHLVNAIENHDPKFDFELLYMFYSTRTFLDSTGSSSQRCEVWDHIEFDQKLINHCLSPVV